MGDKFSVIVPVYNVEPYLRQCLDSIVDQTYRNLEIILVDDGSPDNCGAICDEYAAKDDRITVVHKANGGLSAAWNDGMRNASGQWISFVDSDDWLDVDYFEKLMAGVDKAGGKDASIVLTGGRTDEKDGVSFIVRSFVSPAEFRTDEEKDELKQRIHISQTTASGEKLSYTGYAWGKLYRTSFLRKYHLQFDEAQRGCQDLLFNYQAFDMAGNIVGCEFSGGGYHYRLVSNGITRQYLPSRQTIWHDYLSKLSTYIESRGGITLQDKEIINFVAIRTMIDCMDTYYFHPQNPDSISEKAKKIAGLKKMPIYREALQENSNPYLTPKMNIYKMLMRLPFIWPLVWPLQLVFLFRRKVMKR